MQNYAQSSECSSLATSTDPAFIRQLGVGTLGGVFIVLAIVIALALVLWTVQICFIYRTKGWKEAVDFTTGRGRFANDGGVWEGARGASQRRLPKQPTFFANNLTLSTGTPPTSQVAHAASCGEITQSV